MFAPEVVQAVCRHMDDDHADAALLIARVLGGVPRARSVRTVGVDAEGIDLLAQTDEGPVRVRVPFAGPARERADLRTAVVALHARARDAAAG